MSKTFNTQLILYIIHEIILVIITEKTNLSAHLIRTSWVTFVVRIENLIKQ